MLKNNKAKIEELRRVEEGATIRRWIEIGEEDIFIAPAGNELRSTAETYQIFGEPCEGFVSSCSIIETGHRLIVGKEVYEVKGVRKYYGSMNVDSKHLILERKNK